MIIEVSLPNKNKLVCGKPCFFCRFDYSDDNYHCIFLDDDAEDIFSVNLHAEERNKYSKCPVRIVGIE